MSRAPTPPPSVLALVRKEAHRIARLMPDGAVEFDDLVGHGHLGLMEAQQRFDPRRGVNFELYARHRIRGAIFDGLRQSLGPLKFRTYRRLRLQLQAWQLAGDPPPRVERDPEQRAHDAEVTFAAIADLATAMLVDRASTQPDAPDPEQQLEHAEDLARVRRAVDALPPDERELIRACHDLDGTGDSGAALARRRGINRSSIARRHKAVLARLRRRLAERPP